MLEWIYRVELNPPQWEGPGDFPFASPIRCKLVRGAPAHFVVTLFLRPGLRPGDAAAQLNKLNAVDLIWPGSSKGHMASLNHQKQGDDSDQGNEQHRQSSVHNGLPHSGQQRQGGFYSAMPPMDLWYWLTNLGVFWHEIGKKPTTFFV